MPLYGIDPDGLMGLAGAVSATGDQVRRATQPALAVLDRNGRTGAATELAGCANRFGMWSNDVGSTLHWRANVINEGQNSRLDVTARLRTQFAIEALFTASTLDTTYHRWMADQAAQEHAVANAVANITRWLSQGITDWDVSNNDLHNIKLAMEALNEAGLDRVLQTLTPVQLERWIAEMGHRINGFSRDEKREVFALLAMRASGNSLRRVHDAILAVATTDEVADLGAAIRVHSSDDDIVRFVRSIATRDLTSHHFSTLAPMLAMTGIDDGAAATAATKIFVDTEAALGSTVRDSLLHDESGSLLSAWISVLNRTTDDADRAAAFATFATLAANRRGLLGELIGDSRPESHIESRARQTQGTQTVAEAQRALLAAATQLMEGDPAATIKHLASNLDPEGIVTSAYWQLMVENGNAASIGNILRALRGGGEVDIDAFSAVGPDPDYRYPHARNLAFAAATLNRGFVAAADAAKGDIDTISRLAGVATAVVGLVTKGADLITSLVGTGTDLGVAGHAKDVKDDIDAQLANLIDTVTGQLRPTDENIHNPPTGLSGALTAWLNLYTGLLDRA